MYCRLLRETIALLKGEIVHSFTLCEVSASVDAYLPESLIKGERERLKLEKQANMDRADYNDKMLELKNKQIEVEIHQQWDGNPYNDKIKDI